MKKKRPNLVYVFADQLRYQSLGYAGDQTAQTPNIDRLCSQSVDLCNAVSGHPVCAPYRASLLTGKYTTSTGMVINEIRINPEHHTFADVLSENGYETAYIGKWHMYANELGNHYDSKNSFIPKGRDRLGFNDYFAAYNFRHEYGTDIAYYHLDTPEKIRYHAYEPDEQTDMALQQMERLAAGEKPFALFLSLGTPHDPWEESNVPSDCLKRFEGSSFLLPPNYLPDNDEHADNWARLSEEEREKLPEWKKVYYAMVANLDDNIGKLLRGMQEMGLEENTILVFTSDHGELFGAHGRRAKNIFYEEAVRIPFLIRWPGVLEEGSKRNFVLNTVDIMPSLLTLMELPVPEEVEGSDRSLCIMGKEDTEDGALMMGTGPTAVWGDGYEWRAYRTKRYTFAVYKKDGMEFLFDNQEDPYQMHNLIGENGYEEIANRLKAAMHGKMESIGDNFEWNSHYEKFWVENRIIKKKAEWEEKV